MGTIVRENRPVPAAHSRKPIEPEDVLVQVLLYAEEVTMPRGLSAFDLYI